MRAPARWLASEPGHAVVEGLLALGLVLLTVALAVQAIAYAHARSVAIAAAQEGARAAAAAGPEAGLARANELLSAAGGAGAGLHSSVSEQVDEVTVAIEGQAPRLFALPLLLPAVTASASLPRERYPTAEAAP
jgi:hypothetical protein